MGRVVYQGHGQKFGIWEGWDFPHCLYLRYMCINSEKKVIIDPCQLYRLF
jgi:hypothetical protein